MLCSKLRCQKGFNLIRFSNKIELDESLWRAVSPPRRSESSPGTRLSEPASSFGFRIPDFRVSDFRVSDFGVQFRVPGLGFSGFDFGFEISDLGSPDSVSLRLSRCGSRFRVVAAGRRGGSRRLGG